MWNNIFFSFAFDGHDHYKKLGGDSAARAASVSIVAAHISGDSLTICHTHIEFLPV